MYHEVKIKANIFVQINILYNKNNNFAKILTSKKIIFFTIDVYKINEIGLSGFLPNVLDEIP